MLSLCRNDLNLYVMHKIGKVVLAVTLVLMLVLLFAPDLAAQCPMCRMSAESNLKNGGTEGRGLNTGILYMLAMPYMLVAAIGYWWWRNRKSTEGRALGAGEDDFGHSN